MPPPGVSVIIVNWNTRELVLRLLASLSSPSAPSEHELELIVVDNNSSDGIVEAIRREFPEVKLLAETKNHGFAGGVNRGVKAATQPLVLLLNSDAQTSRASIEEAAQYMSRVPEAGVLGPQILSTEQGLQSSAWRDPSLAWMGLNALGLSKLKPFNFERYHEKRFEEATVVHCVCGAAMMIRRELLGALGGFDEDFFMYFEETDFCVRARQRGQQVHYAPVGQFLHEEGGTSKTVRLRTFLDYKRSEILFHRKHAGMLAAIAARALLVFGCAVRVPVWAVLSLAPGSAHARAQLRLHWSGLTWLINPFSRLVPDVDRSE